MGYQSGQTYYSNSKEVARDLDSINNKNYSNAFKEAKNILNTRVKKWEFNNDKLNSHHKVIYWTNPSFEADKIISHILGGFENVEFTYKRWDYRTDSFSTTSKHLESIKSETETSYSVNYDGKVVSDSNTNATFNYSTTTQTIRWLTIDGYNTYSDTVHGRYFIYDANKISEAEILKKVNYLIGTYKKYYRLLGYHLYDKPNLPDKELIKKEEEKYKKKQAEEQAKERKNKVGELLLANISFIAVIALMYLFSVLGLPKVLPVIMSLLILTTMFANAYYEEGFSYFPDFLVSFFGFSSPKGFFRMTSFIFALLIACFSDQAYWFNWPKPNWWDWTTFILPNAIALIAVCLTISDSKTLMMLIKRTYESHGVPINKDIVMFEQLGGIEKYRQLAEEIRSYAPNYKGPNKNV